MATKNTDFLHFNAYSIKEMIIRKLTEDGKFTDQVYEGSNLNILIDLVSYMYQCLMYSLNNAAAESMFADTRLYENMNRLVKFLGYNPKGIIPSTAEFYINTTEADTLRSTLHHEPYILKYTSIDTKKVDENGNTIYYSTISDIHIDNTVTNGLFKFQMYNGKWQLYNQVFEAAGTDYESFLLTGIGSDTENANGNINYLVANNCVHVYVEHSGVNTNGDPETTLTQFNVIDDELFINTEYDNNVTSYARIYNRNDAVVNVRLNENKQYEIKFGNGIIGKKLAEGDRIYVMYLATNGMEGSITFEDFTDGTLIHDASTFGMTTELYNLMFKTKDVGIVSDSNDQGEVIAYLANNSSKPIAEESVEDIRRFAPEWFKMGQRLITKTDYEFYIKNLRKGEVVDVICQNNYEYAATFYKWLYELGTQNHLDEGGGKYYLNRFTITKFRKIWADPVDISNVYLWVKMYGDTSIHNLKAQYIDEIQKIKCMTSNVVFMDAIDMNFSVTAMPEYVIKHKIKENNRFPESEDSYIEVTLANDILYASGIITNQITNIIKSYFESDDIGLGKTINYNTLLSQLYAINGVERIRTIYIPGLSTNTPDVANSRIIEGLAFATWSASVIDLGDDLQVSSAPRTLQPFHYPKFYDVNLQNRIRVIRKSVNNGIRVQN